MGTALIAYVHRSDRRIELDPAVRAGARLDGTGEALLLYTTSTGHCAETADHVAAALRRWGWRVSIREFDDVQPLRDALEAGPGMVAAGAAERLCTDIGPPADEQPGPQPLIRKSRRGYGLTKRFVCRTCQHVTNAPGRDSHVRSRGHHTFDTVYRADLDAYIAHVRAHGLPPEGAGEVWQGQGALGGQQSV